MIRRAAQLAVQFVFYSTAAALLLLSPVLAGFVAQVV